MNFWQRLWGHFSTVTRHRHCVIAHCARAGILLQGLRHDLSKYTPTEFLPGVRYYVGTRSPNELEREACGYSAAWLHHKGRNRHHFEYWNDFNAEKRCYLPVKMPLRYLAEMFCDRVAASKIYRGKDYTDSDPLHYYQRGAAAYHMHPDTAALLLSWLTLLSEQGEIAVFTEIRRVLGANKEY